MYDELIKALRNCTNPDKCCENCGLFDKCYKSTEHFSIEEQAADAIEELQKDLERSKDFEAFWQHEAEEALKKFQVAISNKPRWIPVTERLPEKYDRVLVFSKATRMGRDVDFINANGNWFSTQKVSHWMPLPPPPESEKA